MKTPVNKIKAKQYTIKTKDNLEFDCIEIDGEYYTRDPRAIGKKAKYKEKDIKSKVEKKEGKDEKLK